MYLPEGLRPVPLPEPEALARFAGRREIFQAMCVKCDEHHNLLVDLGPVQGLIPRVETAMGVPQGTAREIAILSRVGKPVCFRVMGRSPGGTLLLTRRGPQEEAMAWFL